MVIYFRFINHSNFSTLGWVFSLTFSYSDVLFEQGEWVKLQQAPWGTTHTHTHTQQLYLCTSIERPWLVETIVVGRFINYCPTSLPCKILVFARVWIWVLPRECVACVTVIHLEYLQETQAENHRSSSCSLPNRSNSGSIQFTSSSHCSVPKLGTIPDAY